MPAMSRTVDAPTRRAPRPWLAAALAAMAAVVAVSAPAGPVPTPPAKADKGIVFFYWDGEALRRSGVGQSTPFSVRLVVEENGVAIGVLRNGTYFYRYADPGRQHYAIAARGASNEADEPGTFVEVEAGERHYVQVVAREVIGGIEARPYPKYPAQARRALERLSAADPGPRAGGAEP